MEGQIDKAYSMTSSLNRLLDLHYVLLFASFAVFCDLSATHFLEASLIATDFENASGRATIGAVVIAVLAFALYLMLIPKLKVCYDKWSCMLLVPIAKCLFGYPNDTISDDERKYAVFDFQLREYAFEKNNSVMMEAYRDHVKLRMKAIELDKSMFALGLLLFVSRAAQMDDTLNHVVSSYLGMNRVIVGFIGFYLMGYSVRLETLHQKLIYGLGPKLVAEVQRHSKENYFN